MKGTYEIELELNELKILLLKEMLADFIMDGGYAHSDVVGIFIKKIDRLSGKETE